MPSPTARFPRSERLLNMAILAAGVVCVAVWTTYIYRTLQPAHGTYAVGGSLANVPPIQNAVSHADQTVLIYVNSQCNICTESLPFYRTLSTVGDRRTTALRLIGVSREPNEVLSSYFSAAGVTVDELVTIEETSLFRQTRTPAIMLVRRDGMIEEFWLGRLTPEEERTLLAIVEGTAQN